jgi:hypothetical protein
MEGKVRGRVKSPQARSNLRARTVVSPYLHQHLDNSYNPHAPSHPRCFSFPCLFACAPISRSLHRRLCVLQSASCPRRRAPDPIDAPPPSKRRLAARLLWQPRPSAAASRVPSLVSPQQSRRPRHPPPSQSHPDSPTNTRSHAQHTTLDIAFRCIATPAPPHSLCCRS